MRKERMDGIASVSRDRIIPDNVRIFNEMRAYSDEVSPPERSYLIKRAKNIAFGPKFQSTIKIKLFGIQSFTAAVQHLIIALEQNTKSTLPMTLLVRWSIPWRVSLMLCVRANTKIVMRSMRGC